MQGKMEFLISTVPHLAEQIFEQLYNKSLTKCREAGKSWQKCIDFKNSSWTRIVKIPSKISNNLENHRAEYFELAAETVQSNIFEMIVDNLEPETLK